MNDSERRLAPAKVSIRPASLEEEDGSRVPCWEARVNDAAPFGATSIVGLTPRDAGDALVADVTARVELVDATVGLPGSTEALNKFARRVAGAVAAAGSGVL